MAPALPVVRVTGPGRNVGKTWLTRRLIEALTARGHVVAAIKRSHHRLPADKPGADTDLFALAGAQFVTFGAPDGSLQRTPGPAATLDELLTPLSGQADIVLVEGFADDTFGATLTIAPGEQRPPGADARVRFTSMDGALCLDTAMSDIEQIATVLERHLALNADGDPALRAMVRHASTSHGHRCAGVTLGVRLVLAAQRALGFSLTAASHRLHIQMETARCATDAIAAVTGCTVGSRRMTVRDIGKLAAVFSDAATGRTVRVAVRGDARDRAAEWLLEAAGTRTEEAAYRVLPDEQLLVCSEAAPLELNVEHPTRSRARCTSCGEEVTAPYIRWRRELPWCAPCHDLDAAPVPAAGMLPYAHGNRA